MRGSNTVEGSDFAIFRPVTVSQPFTTIAFGSGSPAARSIAGQTTAWKIRMSLPMKSVSARPPRRRFRSVERPERGQIAHQRIHPHVEDVLRVTRNFDPPPRRGSGDGQISQVLRAQEGEHLVAPGLRPDKIRIRLDVPNQPVPVAGEPKK